METIILEKQECDLHSSEAIKCIVQEVVDKIPVNPKLNSSLVRRRLYERCGPSAFLDYLQLKYPIVDPDTINEDVKLDQSLLLKAFYELVALDDPESKKLADKAKELIETEKYEDKIFIHLEGGEQLIEFDTLLHYLS